MKYDLKQPKTSFILVESLVWLVATNFIMNNFCMNEGFYKVKKGNNLSKCFKNFIFSLKFYTRKFIKHKTHL